MAQSQTGDVDFNRGGGDAEANAVLSDHAVSFRFVVTLKCLSLALDSPQTSTEAPQGIAPSERSRPTAVPAPSAPPAPSVISVVSAPTPPPPPVVPETSLSAARPDVSAPAHGTMDFMPVANIASPPPGLPWELAAPEFRLEAVVPTVLRAFKKAATEVAPDVPPPPQPEQAPAAIAQALATIAESPAASDHSATRHSVLNLYTAPSRVGKPLIWKLGVGALVAVAILIPVWRKMTRQSAHAVQPAKSVPQSATNDAQTSIESGDWVRQAAVGGDPGVKQTRQVVLYKPGLKATNGRIEFAWSTNSGDVGVVFRAQDLGNYYAVHLKLLNPRTTPTLDIEYFSVYQFVESRHIEKFLILPKADPVLRVKLDIFGPAFTLYLQDNAAEYWTDARLTSGAIGFFEEWNRSPQVNGVRISLVQRSELFHKPMLELLARNKPPVLARIEPKALGGS
jgi:hypothetical protein